MKKLLIIVLVVISLSWLIAGAEAQYPAKGKIKPLVQKRTIVRPFVQKRTLRPSIKRIHPIPVYPVRDFSVTSDRNVIIEQLTNQYSNFGTSNFYK